MVVRNKLSLIVAAAVLALIHVLGEYFSGGVVTHYPLADPNNPGISNWWGLLSIPLLTGAVLIVAEKRKAEGHDGEAAAGNIVLQKYYFMGGLVFGLFAALLWEFGQEEYLQYVMLLPWVLSLFLRIYLPETTLGFVLGMTYTFGGVLPVVFAPVIQTVGFIIYWAFNRGGKWLFSRIV